MSEIPLTQRTICDASVPSRHTSREAPVKHSNTAMEDAMEAISRGATFQFAQKTHDVVR